MNVDLLAGFADAPAVDFMAFDCEYLGRKVVDLFFLSSLRGRVQHGKMLANGFLRSVPIQRFGAAIPVSDHTAQIDTDDRLDGIVKDMVGK